MGTFLFTIQFSPRLSTWIQESEAGRSLPFLLRCLLRKVMRILRPKVFINAIEMDIERVVQQAQETEAAPSNCPDGRLFVPACMQSQVLQWGTFLPTLRSPWHRSHNMLHSMQVLVAGDEGGHLELCLRLLGLCSNQGNPPTPPRSITIPPHPSQTFVTHSTWFCHWTPHFQSQHHYPHNWIPPQSNGQTKQANQSMETVLRCLCANNPVS